MYRPMYRVKPVMALVKPSIGRSAHRTFLDTLSYDPLLFIADLFAVDGDIASLRALKATCHSLTTVFGEVLASFTAADYAVALLGNRLPPHDAEIVAKQMATALCNGKLTERTISIIIDQLNAAVNAAEPLGMAAAMWRLTEAQPGSDSEGDTAFRFRGLSMPTSQENVEPAHEAERLPDKLELPHVLAGPSRIVERAGSGRDMLRVRTVPLATCRIHRRPMGVSIADSGCGANLLISALFDHQRVTQRTRRISKEVTDLMNRFREVGG